MTETTPRSDDEPIDPAAAEDDTAEPGTGPGAPRSDDGESSARPGSGPGAPQP